MVSAPRPGWLLSMLLALALVVMSGCDRSKLPYFGQLGEPCYPNQTCAAGLSCLAGRCQPRRDDAGPPDSLTMDRGADGTTTCWPPGKSCISQDPCALQARCVSDGTCQVFERRECDDGLDCTTGRCLGGGLCEYEPKAGWCVASVLENGKPATRCFADGTPNPENACQRCDAKQPQGWSDRQGDVLCDDGDPCTEQDRCVGGTCLGKAYQCDDGLPCTTQACDGQGGCLPVQVQSDSCAVSGACKKSGELAPLTSGGCGSCDPTQSQTAFTPLLDACRIDDQCYRDATAHPSGCASCDVQSDPTSWTIQAGSCLIDGKCAKSGDPGPDACSSCAPQTSTTQWTPDAGSCRIDGACLPDQMAHLSGCLRCDVALSTSSWSAIGTAQAASESFDAGTSWPAGWSESHTDTSGAIRWQVLSNAKQRINGLGALYYGNPALGSYDGGAQQNAGVARFALPALPIGKAGLRFHVWMDVENGDKYDTVELWMVPKAAAATKLWSKPAGQSWLRKWLTVDVELTAFAGQSGLQLEFRFDTIDHLNNTGEGVYIDALTFYSGC